MDIGELAKSYGLSSNCYNKLIVIISCYCLLK